MTVDDAVVALQAAQSIGRGAHSVMVAGHGALHSVTHGAAVDGQRVVILYVEEPAAAESAPPEEHGART